MHWSVITRGLLALLCSISAAQASLTAYDDVINADAGVGIMPLAKLTTPAVLTGANRVAFNFGASSGDATLEFILEGNPAAIATSAYLAVGANASSNLRYEQYQNTTQMGFTQLGVLDYLFSPPVASPTQPAHVTYVWQSGLRTMKLYVNGALAGTAAGVTTAFGMPNGQGWLGGNPSGGELMVGTIHRATVYDDALEDTVIQGHADAYLDIRRRPLLISFSAAPNPIFTPNSSTLTWDVRNAIGIHVDGTDVTGLTNLLVSPSSTTTYSLVATNAGGSVTGTVTVVVNPAPVIHSFRGDRGYFAPGQAVTLLWQVSYGQTFTISPAPGDVGPQTLDGNGRVSVQPSGTTMYTLAAGNAFGTNTARFELLRIYPAGHLVISEFMADNESALADEDGNFSDWIEVYNPTTTSINLWGYFLTDDKSDPTKWAFPEVTLSGGSHLVVFASGNSRTNTAAQLHTNFRLSRTGGYLSLIGPGPVIVHEFDPYPPQGANASYGIIGGDPSVVRSMGIPTPGAANDDTPTPPAAVRFSRASGTFAEPFTLTLATDTPGASIRYTTNGALPNGTNDLPYTGALMITGTTRVRAAAFASGLRSEITGASWIKLAPELTSYTSSLPILVIENFAAGVIPQKGWNSTGAGIKQVPRQDAIWATFERVAGSSTLTNQPDMVSSVGIRGRGAYSTQWRQKPYSAEAITEAGEEREVAPLGMPPHADWVLYFPDPDDNKDPTLLFNTFAYELSARSGRYSVRFRWVEAFVNEDGGELQLADRRGVYALIEKVSRGRDRLDFTKISEDGTQGSWLLNINRMDPEPETGWPAANGATTPWYFHTAGQDRIQQTPPNVPGVGDDEPIQSNGYLNFDNPSGYTVNTNQRAAIEGWFKVFEDVLWNNALWRDPVNGYRKYIDTVDFADYFILNVLTHNGDGLLISIFPWKADDGKLRMGPAWDYNWSPYYISGGPTADLMWRSDRLWYNRLFTDPDFRQLYIDRWWDHRRGPMSNAGIDSIIDGQAAEISVEKALLNGLGTETNWVARLTRMKTWLKDRANWIDSNYLRPPVFNQEGGNVPDGFQVTILGSSGTIYYTTDGSDPRASGGAISASAQAFQLPFTIAAQATVQARVRNGTNWSGLTRAVYYPPQDLTRLVVTEIMFNAPAWGGYSGDELDFVELRNDGNSTLNLGTLTFTAGITFTFTNGTRLEPGAHFLLVRNPAAIINRYPGAIVNGVFTGRLDNGGETIRLATQVGGTVFSITYNDRAPWPITADGFGFSLVPRDLGRAVNSDDGANWRASATSGGSPGTSDSEPTVPPIFINEIMTHTDPPAVDWIELFNPGAQDVSIAGWFLTDDPAAPKKFRIPPETIIPAGEYLTFSETNFNATPESVFSFSFDSAGDSAYLVSADANTNLTGWSHGFSFAAAANGVSFGRYVNSVGEEQFPPQIFLTPNATNAGPAPAPVIISEVHYHPATSVDEFVELHNVSGSALPFFDPSHPTNTWRLNGLNYTFPTNITVPTNGILLLVPTTPEIFRTRYNIATNVLVLGPFNGALQDSGERLSLERPDFPETNGVVPYISVDTVRYNDKAPWSPAADGSGPSLQRKVLAAYGDDPQNWEAAVSTPGEPRIAGMQSPVILTQPQNQVVLSSESAEFAVLAEGAAPLWFQWLFNGSPLPRATNTTLLLENIQPGQAGEYQVVVFNAAGSQVSVPALLTVNRKPTILAQPVEVAVKPGTTATFSVSAVGNGLLRYQWRLNSVDVPDATNATLTIPNPQWENHGFYTVEVRDNVGAATAGPAELILLIAPAFVQAPLSQPVVPGATVTFSAIVTNTANLPIQYRWRTGSRYLLTNILQSHVAYLTITNARPPATNYAVVAVNRASSGVLSGAGTLTFVADSDGDSLPDEWENLYFASATSGDPAADVDNDGLSNAQEYAAGTDPNDPFSYLKIDDIQFREGRQVSFGAVSNRTYTLLFTDRLGVDPWHPLADVPARATNRLETISDPTFTTNRFYRLATPQQP